MKKQTLSKMTGITPKLSKIHHKKQKQSKQTKFWVIGLLLFGIISTLLIYNYKETDFLEFDKDGKAQLTPRRLEKLQKELDDLDAAEQYALKAFQTGWFPCYHCIDKKDIKLLAGEIWKYGTTSKSESIRYGKALSKENLYYKIQFEGNYLECLKEEKRKIYHYATLPENLKRTKKLKRPPGNKIDK